MQAPRGNGFLGKRKKREHGYYPSPWRTSSSEQAVRNIAPPPPPSFFAKPVPRTSKPNLRPTVARLGASAKPALPPPPPAAQGVAGNKLLAGYLAHEFLTYGTLLGERRCEAPPISDEKKQPAAPSSSSRATTAPEPSQRYAEVSRLLMAGGARIPGIFNPSQIGGWLRIKK
jgi:hypothetical protein